MTECEVKSNESSIEQSSPLRRVVAVHDRGDGLLGNQIVSGSVARPLERKNSINTLSPSYAPFITEYTLMCEYHMISQNVVSGVYVIPSAASPQYWFGVLFIHDGIYQDGVFRFCIHIAESFPDSGTPHVVFSPPIFHPLIHMVTGEMDVRRKFPWSKHKHIWQLLEFVKKSFIDIDCTDPLNVEAAHLYETNRDWFNEKVTETVRMSKRHLYDVQHSDDPHFIKFVPFTNNIHEPARLAMIHQQPNDLSS